MFEGLIGLGIACLLAPAIAEYAKLRRKSERGFNWIGVAGIFFLFAGSFDWSGLTGYVGAGPTSALTSLFSILGWLFALVGTLYIAYEVLFK